MSMNLFSYGGCYYSAPSRVSTNTAISYTCRTLLIRSSLQQQYMGGGGGGGGVPIITFYCWTLYTQASSVATVRFISRYSTSIYVYHHHHTHPPTPLPKGIVPDDEANDEMSINGKICLLMTDEVIFRQQIPRPPSSAGDDGATSGVSHSLTYFRNLLKHYYYCLAVYDNTVISDASFIIGADV